MKEPEVRGTIHQYEEFLQNVVWKDFITYIDMMREAVRDELETCADQQEMFRFQGRAEALRDIRIVPEQILEALKEDKNPETKNTEMEELWKSI